MLRLDAGYYILDARCVMLNAKVHRAVPDSGFRGAQAASLPSSAACRRKSPVSQPKDQASLKWRLFGRLAACAPQEPAAPPRIPAL